VLQRALIRAEGNVSAAAHVLGISRATLHRKLARFAISRTH
jgi:transcriptional regulator of acetoin/glycerol metabolism